eukprot:4746203-Prymnesium_polylepis.1
MLSADHASALGWDGACAVPSSTSQWPGDVLPSSVVVSMTAFGRLAGGARAAHGLPREKVDAWCPPRYSTTNGLWPMADGRCCRQR